MILKQTFIALDNDPQFIKMEETKEDTEKIQKEVKEYLLSENCTVVLENASTAPKEVFRKYRFDAFGASDSAVLLGVAFSTNTIPMKTVNELIEEKVTEFDDVSIGEKASVRKGTELEELLISKFAKRMGTVVIKPNDMFGKDKLFHTNFDGIVLEVVNINKEINYYQPIPLEIKLCTMFGRKNYDWMLGVSEFSDNQHMVPERVPPIQNFPHTNIQEHITYNAKMYGVPTYYYTQIQQQMYFAQAPHGYIGVMDDANWTIYLFKVMRDERTIRELCYQGTQAYNKLAGQRNLEKIEIDLGGEI